MKCGYCEAEMVRGYIPSFKGVMYFTPEEVGHNLQVITVPKGAIQLTKFPMWRIEKARSFYCPNCHLVISLPLNDKY